MLKLGDDEFTIGRSKFFDQQLGAAEPTAKIFVKIIPRDYEEPILAQLDTGAAWSVLDSEIAREMGLLAGFGTPKELSTREGLKTGRLIRVGLTIPADDGQGESLVLDAPFFVCPDWPIGRTFLGYSGFLDALRFALDAPNYYFYFGQ